MGKFVFPIVTTRTATMSGFMRLSGLSRNAAYEVLRSGEIDSVITEHGRRLVLLPSWEEYLQRLAARRPREAGAKRQAIDAYRISLKRRGAVGAALARQSIGSRRRAARGAASAAAGAAD